MTAFHKNVLCAVLLLFNSASYCIESKAYELNTATINQEELVDYAKSSKDIKRLIDIALDLAGKKLGYLYGSAELQRGGMDCSGTLFYLLTQYGLKEIPHSSHTLYEWVVKKGTFYSITGDELKPSIGLTHLKPGDLLFWNGTYKTKQEVKATHVMIYLGKNKRGLPLMVGASDGRTYKGKKVFGVSVFDLQIPHGDKKFLGYSCIPDISC